MRPRAASLVVLLAFAGMAGTRDAEAQSPPAAAPEAPRDAAPESLPPPPPGPAPTPAPAPAPPPTPAPAPAPARAPPPMPPLALAPAPPASPPRPLVARRGFVIAGATILAISHGASVVAGAICSTVITCGGTTSHETWLFVPAIGPIVQFERTTSAAGNIVLGADILAQLGGIAMLTYGIAAKVPAPDPETDAARLTLTLAPIAGAGRAGMTIVGWF
jgi:hypothetical protein